MKAHSFKFAIEKMCKVFKVSRSGYYDWLNRKPSARALENHNVKEMIKSIYKESKGRYGSPKITEELKIRGLKLSRPRVARLMRSEGIRSIVHNKFRVVTTDSKHNYPIAENLLNRKFKAPKPGKVWVSDITYISTAQGWLYLTIIMDLFDRKIIGWSLSKTLRAKDTVVAAWRMALINRPLRGRLIFHSDRGVQYACADFRNELKDKPVDQSMSRKGDCWDNAVAESFFKILKSELVRHTHFVSRQQAKLEVFEFIEIWYNRKRTHAYLGYLTPEDFGNNYFLNAA
jgi:transposase InsO family protein